MKEILFAPSPAFMGGRLFDTANAVLNRDNSLRPLAELKAHLASRGYEAKTIDQSADPAKAHALVFMDMPRPSDPYFAAALQNQMSERMVLVLMEPPCVRPDNYSKAAHVPFHRVLTWNDGLVDGKRYRKIHYPMPFFAKERIRPSSKPFGQKKLFCLFGANKYSSDPGQLYAERLKAVQFMERHHPGKLDLYGPQWDVPILRAPLAERLGANKAIRRAWQALGPAARRPANWLRPSWKGAPPSKIGLMGGYRFNICYENQLDLPGYVTEKITDTFWAGAVPVYLGASNIGRYVPADCMVDKKKFSDYADLYAHCQSIGPDEYAGYVERIGRYLNGPASAMFKIERYLQSFDEVLSL